MKTRREAEFVPVKAHAKLTTGEVIRMLRELQGWAQAELGRRSGISATNISLLGNEKVEIGKKRVEQLAKAFDIHPAIIMFPEYEAKEIQDEFVKQKWGQWFSLCRMVSIHQLLNICKPRYLLPTPPTLFRSLLTMLTKGKNVLSLFE